MSKFNEIKKMLNDAGMETPCNGKNESGEDVIITYGTDEAGPYYRVSTSQSNGWLKVNTYYESGDQTETYEK